MAKHYLKFSSGAADRARQLFSNEIDPLQSAFEDLTARGQRIRFRPHPPTESGPCIELLGTRSSALVGADRRQQGVLFAFHFREPAVTDSASAQAADYPASFRLWQSNAEPGDSVAPLFTSAPSASAPRPPASPQQRARSAPSAVLRAYLGGVPRDIRTRYWPVVASMTFPAEEIAAAVRAWRRHGLDALSLPTKGSWQESVLRGSASVATTRSNADAIWPLFDVLLLERFAVFLQDIPAGETRFHALLQDIAELPIPDPQRARLWLHLVLPRDADTLVSDVASFVSTLRRLSPSAQRVWERHIDDAVRELAPRFPAHEQLEVLRQRVDLADAQDVPIADALADWAGLASTTVASNVAPPLAPPATTSGSWKALSNDAQIPTVAMDADASSDAPLLDQWVLATLGSGEDVVRTLRRATGDIVSLLKAVEEEPSSTKVLLTLSEHAEAIQLTINEWRVLPPAERISRQMNSCADAYARAKGDVPLSMLHQLMSRGIEPDAVVEIADLCKHRDIWKAMPRWWWTRIPGTGTPDPIDQEAEPWMAAFADPAHRRLARFGLKLISENELAKANLELLEAIPPPEHGIDPDRHLESKLHELTEAQVAVRRIEERLPAFVPLGQALPQQDFIELAERFANLSDWLSKGCAEAIACELVKAPSAAPSRLSAFEKKLGTLQGLGLSKELLRAMSFEEMRKGIELIGSEGDASPPIEFSHALVPSEGGGNRAPRVAFRPFDDDAAFGTVAVPITLRAQAPASTRLALQYANVTDPQLGQWPLPLQERADVGPRELHLLEGDWTRAPGQDRWQYTFIGHIPVRRPATGDSVTLMVTAVDAVSAQVVGRSKQLQWTIAHVPAAGPGDARPDIPLQWSEGINLEYARNHPVGPQKQSGPSGIRVASRRA